MQSTPKAEAILAGDRRALAKAITLVESQRAEDRAAAQNLLNAVLPHTGASIRVGVTGVPGVGKSTFIESFGQHVIDQGHRLAVLAVDPSSPVAGGSILGDKTRMEKLSRSEAAFIRPSPAGRALGGVAFKTRESLLLCEAAGFDVILVETVGVGQSEHQVVGMVDFFLLLMLPGGGDELQGIKKGILELADAIVVNKADGESETLARITQQHYRGAMSLLNHGDVWEPSVMMCSALKGTGIDSIWQTICEYRRIADEKGTFDQARADQNLAWMRQLIDELLRTSLAQHPAVRAALPEIEAAVINARQTPLAAAEAVLELSRG
ncbi:MAG: methylmalonyl Co-A mutase-associated GTPase MeaB [Luminiphilus sp.]|jgi:LAO/AO transport system kinase|nr:methylmalonyl Co-A mutase-associated GTPase MeaB [Luminiphilus sp.]